MDPRITNLEAATFFGRRLTRRRTAGIQETVAPFPNGSRSGPAKTVRERLNWRAPKGGCRVPACLRAPERLEGFGILTLPEKRDSGSGALPTVRHTAASDPQPGTACGLSAPGPLPLRAADGSDGKAGWNGPADRHRCPGCPRPFGPHLRRSVPDRDGPAPRLPAVRGGVADAAGPRRLDRMERAGPRAPAAPRAGQFPVHRVSAGGRAEPCAADPRHGGGPSSGGTGAPPRLPPGAVRDVHRPGPLRRRAPPRGQPGAHRHDRRPDAGPAGEAGEGDPRPAPRPGLPRRPPGTRVPGARPASAASRPGRPAGRCVAADHRRRHGAGRRWMKRRRILNGLAVMPSVFRLVLPRGEKGCAAVTAGLRERCRRPGIALPQRGPVAAPSVRKARQRVHGELFPDLHRGILRHGGGGARWRGHRLFAIDGTKMNLPRGWSMPASRSPPAPANAPRPPSGTSWRATAPGPPSPPPRGRTRGADLPGAGPASGRSDAGPAAAASVPRRRRLTRTASPPTASEPSVTGAGQLKGCTRFRSKPSRPTGSTAGPGAARAGNPAPVPA